MKKKFFVFLSLFLLLRCGFSEIKHKTARISGKFDVYSVSKTVDSILEGNEDLFILDFSKSEISDGETKNVFRYWDNSRRIQGIILPESTEKLDFCICPDLKFIQFSSSVKTFGDYPVPVSSLRYIFITGKTGKADEKTSLRFYNSARIIHEESAEYARKKGFSLFTLDSAEREPDFKPVIPEEKITASEAVTSDCDSYRILTKKEESDRRLFNTDRIEPKKEEYKIVLEKMNDFAAWNLNKFSEEVLAEWTPRMYQIEFLGTFGGFTVCGPVMSVSYSFSYYSSDWIHGTFEYKTFCYDSEKGKFLDLSEASGWTLEELQKIIEKADLEHDEGFEPSNQTLSLETIKDLNFTVLPDGKIRIFFSDYIFSRYSYTCVIDRKPGM